MIYSVVGNVLDRDFTHIIHQANLFHVFGSGLAKQIKSRYIEAYHADLLTVKGDKSRLGTFSWALTTDGKIVYNLYSQVGIGSTDRQTSYDAMDTGLRKIRSQLREHHGPVNVGIPYRLGCGLANGNWGIVYAIIESIFEQEKFPVTIVELPAL